MTPLLAMTLTLLAIAALVVASTLWVLATTKARVQKQRAELERFALTLGEGRAGLGAGPLTSLDGVRVEGEFGGYPVKLSYTLVDYEYGVTRLQVELELRAGDPAFDLELTRKEGLRAQVERLGRGLAAPGGAPVLAQRYRLQGGPEVRRRLDAAPGLSAHLDALAARGFNAFTLRAGRLTCATSKAPTEPVELRGICERLVALARTLEPSTGDPGARVA